jgi:hypothetical protein
MSCLYMCVSVCVRLFVICVCMCTCVYVFVRMCAHLHVHTNICVPGFLGDSFACHTHMHVEHDPLDISPQLWQHTS